MLKKILNKKESYFFNNLLSHTISGPKDRGDRVVSIQHLYAGKLISNCGKFKIIPLLNLLCDAGNFKNLMCIQAT